MYITDVNHFLDDKGAIAPLQGPARAMADFLACVIAYASDFGSTGILAARCFKCKKGTVSDCTRRRHLLVVHAVQGGRTDLELAGYVVGPQ